MRLEQHEARPFVMLSQICTAHCSSGNQFLSRTTLPRGGRCSVFLARFTSADMFYYLSTSESMRPSGERDKGCLSILSFDRALRLLGQLLFEGLWSYRLQRASATDFTGHLIFALLQFAFHSETVTECFERGTVVG